MIVFFSFNPCRVFSGLATQTLMVDVQKVTEFQSLSGFFRPCNLKIYTYPDGFSMFQSLSGFFRPCNQKPRRCGRSPRRRFNPCRVFSGLATSHEIVSTSAGPRFQSLSGFFRPCNGDDRVRVIHQEVVSIPVGFFQALQRRTGCSGAATLSLFQSLSGFFRPCNAVDPQIHHGLPLFQSLSGFFRPCNVTRSHPAQLRGRCFNPCRVFSGLATHNSRGGSPRVLSFQSLSGFFRPCNWSCSRRCWSDRGVSIPVGFFQALQRPGLVHLRVGERQVSIPVGFFQALQRHPWVGYFSI